MPFIRRVFVVNVVVPFPLPCGFRLALHALDQRQYIVCRAVYIFPYELVRVSRRPRIAASPADENLAIILR